jgi:hypothetical protein
LIALFTFARRGNALTNNEQDALPAEPLPGLFGRRALDQTPDLCP